MYREVFRDNLVGNVLFSIVFASIFTFIAIVSGNIFIYLLLTFPILICLVGVKRKLVIDNEILYFHNVLKVDEVPLQEVGQFRTESMVMGSSGGSARLVHVVDKTGETRFDFPLKFITGRNRRRFEDNILAINGSIIFTVASIESEKGMKRNN